MGAMFRSEEMALAQLFIQPEIAYQLISELGETGIVQFRDLNPDLSAYQRKFVNEVRRCDELERKLRFIESELKKDDVNIPDVAEMPKAPIPKQISDLEAHLEKTENDVLELNDNATSLKKDFLQLAEFKHVLEKTDIFLSDKDESGQLESLQRALGAEDSQNRGKLSFVSGVIERERMHAFETMLWRISRGNVFVRQTEIDELLEDPTSGTEVKKAVFVIFFQGDQLKSRIQKVCAGFRATLYGCPSVSSDRQNTLKDINTRIEDLNMVLNQTKDYRQRVLVGVSKDLRNWIVMVLKMKAIYHTLNFFNMDVSKKCLIGECWIPVNDISRVQEALATSSTAGGSSIPSFLNIISTNEQPPTFNRLNKFTRGFQNLIDSYGVASYRECNPALYTIITFPFLFAIMFGDLGHGFILLLFALFLVIYEKKLQAKKINSEVFQIFFAGRYIVLVMGLFSMYTGFVYNDVFSKSMNIFGSSWSIGYNVSTVDENPLLTLDPAEHYSKTPYPFGLDPIWQGAKNKIIFLNGYKMKLSIIFGVVHMIFGVSMSVVNYVHFNQKHRIVLEFVPQILFLVLLFFWMVVMMFMKWIMYSAENNGTKLSTACAPSILIYFINMMLFKHSKVLKGCEEYMFSFQEEFQLALVLISVLCIPVMLLGIPIYTQLIRKARNNNVVASSTENGGVGNGIELHEKGAHEEEEHEEPIGEIYIHQAIHTIEYVLSTISHTASYLRLWALSLAHAQLSEVLWNMILRDIALKSGGWTGAVMIYVLFYVWSVFTLGILVMMEGLSAFLHTLRLHWVEFMSKFYNGLGYPFEEFCFKKILEQEEKPEE